MISLVLLIFLSDIRKGNLQTFVTEKNALLDELYTYIGFSEILQHKYKKWKLLQSILQFCIWSYQPVPRYSLDSVVQVLSWRVKWTLDFHAQYDDATQKALTDLPSSSRFPSAQLYF